MKKRPFSKAIFTTAIALSFTGISHAQWDYKTDVKRQIEIQAINCSGCNLTGQDYNGVKIKNSNLSGAILDRANLSGGSLIKSNLSGAHLKKAFLVRVKGRDVVFNGANLNNSTLTELDVTDSEFKDATLNSAELRKAKFHNTNFKEANLGRVTALAATFENCQFEKANFMGANLTKTDFANSNLQGAMFGGANLSAVSFKGADLSGARMASSMGLTQAQLDDACGDDKTELPVDLTITYCVEVEAGRLAHEDTVHEKMAERDLEIALRTERAMRHVEKLMKHATPEGRRALQRVHSDLSAIQRKIEE